MKVWMLKRGLQWDTAELKVPSDMPPGQRPLYQGCREDYMALGYQPDPAWTSFRHEDKVNPLVNVHIAAKDTSDFPYLVRISIQREEYICIADFPTLLEFFGAVEPWLHVDIPAEHEAQRLFDREEGTK